MSFKRLSPVKLQYRKATMVTTRRFMDGIISVVAVCSFIVFISNDIFNLGIEKVLNWIAWSIAGISVLGYTLLSRYGKKIDQRLNKFNS